MARASNAAEWSLLFLAHVDACQSRLALQLCRYLSLPPPPGEHPPDSLVRPQLQRGPQCEGSELSTQPAFWAFPRAVFEFPGLPAPFPSRDNALNGVTSCTWRLGLRILDCEAVQPQSCLSKRSSSTKQPTGGTDTDAIRLPANHRRLLGSDSLQARSPRPFLLSARDAKII
jgi:hypothetical protein